MGRGRGRGHKKVPQKKKQNQQRSKNQKKTTPVASQGTSKKRKRGRYRDLNTKHSPKNVRPEQVEKIAAVYFGGNYHCVGDQKKLDS